MINKKKLFVVILVLLVMLIGIIVFTKPFFNKPNNSPIINQKEGNNSFEYEFLKEVNQDNTNYLVSPLSVGYALTMLNEGADENTREEITKVLNNYLLPDIKNISRRLGLANGLFIKETYKKDINESFINNIKINYDAHVLFDEFDTPDLINQWVKEKTFNMIPNLINNLSEDFVLGIVNAIAIDVEWKDKFECTMTSGDDFTKNDGSVIKSIMMHGKADSYIENDNIKGIVKDYKLYDKTTGEQVFEKNSNTISLEYIAILPNDDLYSYINNFSKDELDSLLSNKKDASNKLDITVSLPRYSYEYELNEFKSNLLNLGIKDAFNPTTSNFKKISTTISGLYVNRAIHKTNIDLNENGTKAAAATYLGIDKSMILENNEKINLEFNKPFMYIIKEKNSDNIWFIGTVYEPALWKENIEICK